MNASKRFECCGGNDCHPQGHCSDCSVHGLRIHSHADNGRNLCDPGYGWLTRGSYAHRPETPRYEVTCKRCLASLAKRDRAFQRKARRGLDFVKHPSELAPGEAHAYFTRLAGVQRGMGRPGDAARAIAREEGRAL